MGFLGIYLDTDLGTALGTNLAPSALSFSKVSFFNASERYIEYGGSRTGPFGANVPATRVIGGKTYVQIEKAITQSVPYSSDISASWWNPTSLDRNLVEATTEVSPCGDNTSVFRLSVKAGSDIACRVHSGSIVGAGIFSFYLKNGTQGNIASYRYYPNNSALVNIADVPTQWTRYQVLSGYGSDNYCVLYVNLDGETGTGITNGDNKLYWGMQVEVGEIYAHSPIPNNTGSAKIKAADEAILAAADVPSWLRNTGYKKSLIPEYSSVQLAAEGTDKVLDCFVTTAETITIKLASNGKIYIDGSVSGNLFTSTVAHTWSAQQVCLISVRYNNGANCVVTTSGFTTGNAVQTGTAFAVADGDIYMGMTDAIASHFNGLMSLWEPL